MDRNFCHVWHGTQTANEASQAPEIQTMYNMPLPISAIRTRVRQEFERNRYAAKLPVVDVLLFKSHAEYQVRSLRDESRDGGEFHRLTGRENRR